MKKEIKRAEFADNSKFDEQAYEDIKCPKCGKKMVISWTEQTRASDEPPTRFYKCMNCGYTWREYS